MHRKKNTPKTPFPTQGEVFRIIVSALDVKQRNKDVDRLARDGDFSHTLLAKLSEDLIQKTFEEKNPKFSAWLMDSVDELLKRYIKIVLSTHQEAMTRQQTLAILIEHFFIPYAATRVREIFGVIPPFLEKPEKNAIDAVFVWLEQTRNLNIEAVFDKKHDDVKIERRKISCWRTGKNIPDLQQILDLSDRLKGHADDSSVAAFRAAMILARALEWLNKQVKHLRFSIKTLFHYEMILNIPRDLPKAFHEGHQQACQSMDELIHSADTLFNLLLDPTRKKQPEDKIKTHQALKNHKKILNKQDPKQHSRYLLDWYWGRYHVLSGNPKEALSHYKNAFKYALYRAGEDQIAIINEAFCVAAYCENKVFLNKLKHQSTVFGAHFSKERLGDSVKVIEGWEIASMINTFHDLFPDTAQYPHCPKNVVKQGTRIADKSGSWIPPTIKKLSMDYKKPSKNVKFSLWPTGIRTTTQLIYCAIVHDFTSFEKLLAAGANINGLSEVNESALCVAINVYADAKDRRFFDAVSQHDHKPEIMNQRTLKKQLTPLGNAVEEGADPNLVEKLITMGAKVDKRFYFEQQTALDLCMEKYGLVNNFKKSVQVTMETEETPESIESSRRWLGGALGGVDLADQKRLQNRLPIEEKRQIFVDQLQLSRDKHSLPNIIKTGLILLENGANPNAIHDSAVKGYTPLMLAAENNAIELFVPMVEKYNGNPTLRNGDGYHCLDIAKIWRADKIVAYLNSQL